MPIISFWINAFIPRDVPGYTKLLTAGPHMGKTAIPLPGIARLWPGNTTKDWNAGYLTDQRDFDAAPTAAARMKCLGKVDLPSMTLINTAHTSSGTTEVNLGSGAQTGFAVADMSRCYLRSVLSMTGSIAAGPNLPKGLVAGSKWASYYLNAAAGDPLVGMAADIDFVGTFTIQMLPAGGGVQIDFDGKIDEFPAYDAYAQYNGVTKALFTIAPPKGNTVADLLGPANRPTTGTAKFF